MEIKEYDEAGELRTVYIGSGEDNGLSRIDVVELIQAKKPAGTAKTARQVIFDVFLPLGYPTSVTEDYLSYQIYVCPSRDACSAENTYSQEKDSLQAFASSIAGLLASRAVLEGVGVGDSSASPTAAILLQLVQESMGRVATIIFAWRVGKELESECKKYRLAADVFNDISMVLDCLSPVFPKAIRVCLLGLSSTLRALCGVAAGSKAVLSAHFARRGNLGELNAKDASQETIISLMGMVVGSAVVSRVTSTQAVWSLLALLLALHLGLNYAAVKAIKMRSLNRARACLVFSELLECGQVLSVDQVAELEPVFERDGVLRWRGGQALGYGIVGVSLETLLKSIPGGTANATTGSFKSPGATMATLLVIFGESNYILYYHARDKRVLVVFKRGAKAQDQLRAWMHALIIAKRASVRNTGYDETSALAEISTTLLEVNGKFEQYIRSLKEASYDLETAAIETQAGSRVAF